LPVNRPRALTACRSPHGSTRLRRGITPSCQPATSVHLAVVTIARCVDTMSNAGAAPCGQPSGQPLRSVKPCGSAFTQELPRTLLPTRAKAAQSHLRQKLYFTRRCLIGPWSHCRVSIARASSRSTVKSAASPQCGRTTTRSQFSGEDSMAKSERLMGYETPNIDRVDRDPPALR